MNEEKLTIEDIEGFLSELIKGKQEGGYVKQLKHDDEVGYFIKTNRYEYVINADDNDNTLSCYVGDIKTDEDKDMKKISEGDLTFLTWLSILHGIIANELELYSDGEKKESNIEDDKDESDKETDKVNETNDEEGPEEKVIPNKKLEQEIINDFQDKVEVNSDDKKDNTDVKKTRHTVLNKELHNEENNIDDNKKEENVNPLEQVSNTVEQNNSQKQETQNVNIGNNNENEQDKKKQNEMLGINSDNLPDQSKEDKDAINLMTPNISPWVQGKKPWGSK